MRCNGWLMVTAAIAGMGVGPVGAATAPEIFRAANQAFQAKQWDETIKQVDQLFGVAVDLPVGERSQLVPPALFLRAGAEAMLGRDEEAARDFRLHRLFVPEARIDESRFPKKIVKAHERSLRGRDDVGAELAAFRQLPETVLASGPLLAASALRLVLTPEELAALAGAGLGAAAEAQLVAVLEAHGSGPEVAAAADEILDRIAFAELCFGAGGATSDRGTVLLLLGGPSHVRFPLVKDNQAAAAHVGESRSMGGSLENEGVETWVYRDQRRPTFFDAKSVELNFQIDRSRGTWTLEKMFPAPVVVEGAAKVLRETGRLAG